MCNLARNYCKRNQPFNKMNHLPRHYNTKIKIVLRYALLQLCILSPLVSLANRPPDWSEFYIHMRNSLYYPYESQLNNIQGDVIVQFKVNTGLLDSLSIHTSLKPDFDAEVTRRIKKFPDFKSIEDGNYSFRVCFRLLNVTSAILNENAVSPKGYQELEKLTFRSLNADSIIYDFISIQRQPEFSGGMKAFANYLKENAKYPQQAKNKQIQGKVFASFVIERDGRLADIRIDRKLGYGLDEEALRLLQSSPKWIPGMQRDRIVRTKYNIAIPFEL